MIPKLTVTHLRVLFIVVNLGLTGAVGAHAVYRVMNPDYSEEDPRLRKWMSYDPETLKAKKHAIEPRSGGIQKVQGIGQILDPPPLIPKPEGTTDDTTPEEPEEVVEDGNLVEGGPLEEKWEFVSAIVYRPGHPNNQAILQESTGSTRRVGSRVRYRPSTRARTSRTRTTRTTRSSNQNMKVLKLFSGLKIDDAEEAETITVVGIENDRFIYVVDSEVDLYKARSIDSLEELQQLVRGSKRYYLTRTVHEPFSIGDGGWYQPPSDEEEEEEEGQTANRPKQPKPVTMIGQLSTKESAFVRRLMDPASAEGVSPARQSASSSTATSDSSDDDNNPPGSVRSSSRTRPTSTSSRTTRTTRTTSASTRPKSKAEQVAELKNTLKEIESKAENLDPKKKTELERIKSTLK